MSRKAALLDDRRGADARLDLCAGEMDAADLSVSASVSGGEPALSGEDVGLAEMRRTKVVAGSEDG